MRIVVVALGLLSLAAGGAGAQEEEAALPATRLAALALDGGITVEFLEAEPGEVFIVEEGAWPVEPVLPGLDLPEDATAADVHRALAPTRAVPGTLRAAVARAPADVGAADAGRARAGRARVDRLPDEAGPLPDESREPQISEAGEPVDAAGPAAVAPGEAGPEAPPVQAVPARPAIEVVPATPVVEAIPARPAAPGAERPAEPPPTGDMEPADLPKPGSATRAEWFQSEFCPGGGNSWCWVNRSGTSTRQFWGLAIEAVAYSCGGTAHLKVQYRRLGKWRSYVSRDILPGYYYAILRVGVPRTRRSVVEGACFHHAGTGF